jgi:predicted acetyltransferase
MVIRPREAADRQKRTSMKPGDHVFVHGWSGWFAATLVEHFPKNDIWKVTSYDSNVRYEVHGWFESKHIQVMRPYTESLLRWEVEVE